MTRMTAGHAVVRQLVAEGVDTVFAVPGYQVMHIYDGFHDSPEVRLITCRHEQTAVFAADGYARTTGKIGVALVVPGPGAYNAGAAMATAYASSSPVLLISGQMSTDELGREHGALHEINDQLDFMRPVAKWLRRAESPDEVPALLHEAFRQLKTGRPQPVEVEVPQDYLAESRDFETIEAESYPAPPADPALIARAASMLAEAERPAIIAGDGVIRADACQNLKRVAEALGAPVLLSTDARGALPDSHPLAFTSPHTPYSDSETLRLLRDADVVMVVGARVNESAAERMGVEPGQTWVHVDVDPARLETAFDPSLTIEADARSALSALADELRGRRTASAWSFDLLSEVHEKRRRDLDRTYPAQMAAMAELDARLPDETVYLAGVTVGSRWFVAGIDAVRPGGLLTSSYMTTLGYAFPTGLGAKVGNPDAPVISLSGDGGFMYAVGDLATAAQYDIDLVTLVFNNGKFGASQHDQQEGRFPGRVVGTDLRNPDLVALAESFGVLGLRADRLDDLPDVVMRAVDAKRPAVVDVCGDAMAQLDILFR